jgi:hypothetical protein
MQKNAGNSSIDRQAYSAMLCYRTYDLKDMLVLLFQALFVREKMNAKTDTLYHSYLTSIALMNPKHVDWYETTALLIAPSFIHKTKKK